MLIFGCWVSWVVFAVVSCGRGTDPIEGTWKPGHLPPRGQLAVWAVQRGVDSEARCVGVGKKSGRSRLEDLGVLPCGFLVMRVQPVRKRHVQGPVLVCVLFTCFCGFDIQATSFFLFCR